MRKFAKILAVLLLTAVPTTAKAMKFDYTWAYDPLTHQPVLVCESCWFWNSNQEWLKPASN